MAQPEAATGPLTVTSWNLNGARGIDIDQVAVHVQTMGTDILALQEVQRGQARALARALAARSLDWGFKHAPLSTWPEGMAILGITRPVERVRTRAITARWRLLTWRRRIVQTGWLGSLHLVNLHLTPHDEGAAHRERELGGLLAELAELGDGRIVVAGDFNTEPDGAPLAQMSSSGYTTGTKGPTKWRGAPSDREPEREIDYVWASAGLKVKTVTVPRYGDDGFARFAGLSDHLPVTATVIV